MLTAPGVYIEEVDGLSLSVSSSATAVPVFALSEAKDHPWWETTQQPLCINSFSELVSLAKTDGASMFGNEGEWSRPLAPALRAYFANGGGYCYLCPYDQLADAVPQMNDVTLVVQGGEPAATAAIQQICTPGSMLFGLLDGPKEETLESAYPEMTPSDCTAIYYPWLGADWHLTDRDGTPIDQQDIHLVAPSAVVAGLMCKTDLQIGVWKAPSNVPISAGLSPVVKIGGAMQALYTSPDKTTLSVNMIRSFPGHGTLVSGARTMGVSGSNWGYISVRRTCDMVERDIGRALESVLFEPNGPATWEVVRAFIDNYLFNLWRQGALYGETPNSAYFIHIGENITMAQADIVSGILRVRIGLAVVRPAEYMILEFTQQVANGN
ncbi:phage tail sheath family protein [Serratia rubidaea]|nr:phage tail sheath family protein [Serratia rubidaea]